MHIKDMYAKVQTGDWSGKVEVLKINEISIVLLCTTNVLEINALGETAAAHIKGFDRRAIEAAVLVQLSSRSSSSSKRFANFFHSFLCVLVGCAT